MTINATITENDGKIRLSLPGVGFDSKTGRAIFDEISFGPTYDFPDRQDVAPFVSKFEQMHGVTVNVKEL